MRLVILILGLMAIKAFAPEFSLEGNSDWLTTLLIAMLLVQDWLEVVK